MLPIFFLNACHTNQKLKIFNSLIYTSQTRLNGDFSNCKAHIWIYDWMLWLKNKYRVPTKIAEYCSTKVLRLENIFSGKKNNSFTLREEHSEEKDKLFFSETNLDIRVRM